MYPIRMFGTNYKERTGRKFICKAFFGPPLCHIIPHLWDFGRPGLSYTLQYGHIVNGTDPKPQSAMGSIPFTI